MAGIGRPSNPDGGVQNLRPGKTATSWKKGHPSANPSGKATRLSTMITQALREELGEMDVKARKTVAAKIASLLINCAMNPDPEVDKTRLMAINEIIDRCEGRPKQQIDVNDVTADLRARSDADLAYHLEHGHFPEEQKPN